MYKYRIDMKTKITEIEENRKNPKKFFENSNQIKEGFKPQVKMLLNEKGDLVTDKGEIVELFKKYFETLLNRQEQGNANEDVTYYNVEPDIGEPKQEEVARIIETLKNNKSRSENKISAELLKRGGKGLINTLHGVISEVWKRETMPEEWNMAILSYFQEGRSNVSVKL
jgi:hypothetical protein